MITLSDTWTACLLHHLAVLEMGMPGQACSVVCFSSLRELPGAAGDPIPQGTSAHHAPAAGAEGVKVPPAAVP